MNNNKGTYNINIVQETLLRINHSYKLEQYNPKTIYIALFRELICRHIIWIHITICAFQAWFSPIEYFFLG